MHTIRAVAQGHDAAALHIFRLYFYDKAVHELYAESLIDHYSILLCS